jgi:hypothetical protein
MGPVGIHPEAWEMRPHQWQFLAVPNGGAAPAQGWFGRLIGVCGAWGWTRLLTLQSDRDQRFDLSGDCRTASERSEDLRREENTRP